MKNFFVSLLIGGLVACGFLASCHNSSAVNSHIVGEGDTIPFAHATLLRMIRHKDFIEVQIKNPSDTSHLIGHYALVTDSIASRQVPAGITPISVPLRNSIVFAGIHGALINELGKGDIIRGMCDVKYIFDEQLLHALRADRIKDCGKNTSPNIERIISIHPDAVMMSVYEGCFDRQKIEKKGIPVIGMMEFMEPTPLARAEWMRLIGYLVGAEERADSLFRDTEKDYLSLAANASQSGTKPKVIFDRPYGNSWYVSGDESSTGRLVSDAGGRNPFPLPGKEGALPISKEEMLSKGGDAHFWFIRHAGEQISYDGLKSEDNLFSVFRPYKEHKIYVADTSKSRIFEDAAFHPQWILADMISILHPECHITPIKKYYIPLQ